MFLLAALSIVGVLQLLLYVALIALAVVGLRWLLAQMGITVPQPILAIVGFIVLVLVLIWFFGGMH